MKLIFKIIFPLLTVVFSTIGGTEDTSLSEQAENNPAMDLKTSGNLKFIYQVTDMEGNPQSTFAEGENFMFSFVVKNQGDEDVSIGIWPFPIAIDEFFAVYKMNDEKDETIPINKSYALGANTRDLADQTVFSKEEIEYRIPWLTQKETSYIMPIYRPEKPNSRDRRYRAVEPLPEPLPSGEYYSGFTLEYKEKEIKFLITFTIE